MSTLTLTAAPARRPRRALQPRPGRAARRHAAPSTAAPRATLRLTRRGRLLALLVALGLAVTLLVGMGRAVGASTSAPGAPALATVVVAPGQTLWEIALKVAPTDDPRDTVIRLEQLNGLDSAAVRAGQTLLVPALPSSSR